MPNIIRSRANKRSLGSLAAGMTNPLAVASAKAFLAGSPVLMLPPQELVEAAMDDGSEEPSFDVNAEQWARLREMVGIDGKGYLALVTLVARLESWLDNHFIYIIN